MRLFAIPLLVLFLAAGAVAQTPEMPEPQDAHSREIAQATFCNQQYALCIKAPCSPVVTRNADGTYNPITSANCSCEVRTGWSMGPGDCGTRVPYKSSTGQTFLVSTYSNYYNTTNSTLSCPNAKTMWAWCYGSPCVIDEKNPNKAVCTCPVLTQPSMMLGGNCMTDACDSIWSAATPAANVFANNYFYKMGKDQGANPPAPLCVPPTGKQHLDKTKK